ncbi:ankyrin repeat-containing protein ITN1-like [Bidens hawaiensis]|uniref:ankyrin repeat-containing protein ITN1-like n=1 Tax=Bidens hawaiensis TaxID=980011 RepID=UPI00404A43D9
MTPSPSSTSASVVSEKQIDQAGNKKYVKQVTRELHLAAQRGDLAYVKYTLNEIDSDFDVEVSKVVNEVNELGETALYTAAERGHLEVVKELLKYSDKETLTRRSRLEFDTLHIAASQGHHAVVKLLLDHDVSLCQVRSQGNATPLLTAASKGHTAVVQELLSKDPTLLDIPRSNGKNALHLAARSGHVETVKSLLEKDPHLARRSDKKGQTSLHMAVKGANSEVVKLLLEADAAIIMLPDNSGLTALHVATEKKRVAMVNELLRLDGTNVNALTRDLKTALDIAEGLSPSDESIELRSLLVRCGGVRAKEPNQPRDELMNNLTQIKYDVHEMANEVRILQHKVTNNDSNSVTVAVLFAAIAFASIFTVPGGDNDDGMAAVASKTSFKFFFIFNAIALYTALAVVLIHTTATFRCEKAKILVVQHISSKLIWLASMCTLVAFMAASYIVVGRKYEWMVALITVVGVSVMMVVFGTMTYYVVKSKKTRSMKREKISESGANSWRASEFLDSDVERIYAIADEKKHV